MENTQDLKKRLWRIIKDHAYHEGTITLSSGKTSHYYIDARAITLHPEGACLVGRIIFEMVRKDSVRAIGGPTLGADPMAAAVAIASFEQGQPLNAFLIRKTPKAHGRMLQVEGPEIPEGADVVLLDDVATTGGSLIDSIAILKKMGVSAKRAIVIVDREEGAAENLAVHNCHLSSIFRASDFFSPKK